MSWRLRVPASSANLGPGFDALGLALGVYLTCRFRVADTLRIRVKGRDAGEISTAADNLIWKTVRRVAQDQQAPEPPNIELWIDNEVPLGKGLGSSAAALTAGVLIADKILNLDWTQHRILDEAARIEGHPDNVAACVLGSIVASAIDADGAARTVRLTMSQRYNLAVVVPDFMLPTAEARAVLPSTYSRADTIFNVQRSALLIAALATGTTAAFPAALEDKLHQPYRAPLVPGLDDILKLRAPGLLGCSLSGAGPSVLVFYERGYEQVCELVCDVFARHRHQSEVLWTFVDSHGSQIMEDHEPWT